MSAGLQCRLFDPEALRLLTRLVAIDISAAWERWDDARPSDLAEVDVLITSWGAPAIDADGLDAMPRLRAVVHAAGSVKGFLSDEVWRRGVVVTSEADANARPVAEYALAMILLAGKQVPLISRQHRGEVRQLDIGERYPALGNYRAIVGIVGASRVGRRVLELLAPFDHEVLVHDPYLTSEQATALGARKVSLDELMTAARVVSVHAPLLPETENLIDSERLALMSDGATLVNTSRAAVVDQPALLRELRSGRLSAVLDVMSEEPPEVEDELRNMANLTLTPHLAGAFGNELLRLGAGAVAQVGALVDGRRPDHTVDHAALERLA